MNFLESAKNLRDRVTESIDITGFTFEQFLSVGIEGVDKYGEGCEVMEGLGLSIRDTDFADSLTKAIHVTMPVPKPVIQSLCLSAVFIKSAEAAEEHGAPYSYALLLQAAECLGFVLGAAEASVWEDEGLKVRLAAAGTRGAEARHKGLGRLKSWAISEAKQMRGDDAGTARKLAARIPHDLADISKNPERLIYDALREARKSPDS